MALHANELWSTEAGTFPWANVTSAFMAPPTSIQPTSMKVRAHRHSVIYHIQLALWFFLSPVYSCCGHSLVTSVLLVTSLGLLFTIMTPLAWFSPPLPQHCCHPSTMPKERGKPKRGPLYYNFIVRCSHSDPSQPSPPTSSPERGQNWNETPPPSLHAQNSPPPLSKNMHETGSCSVEEEIPPLELHPLEAPLEPSIITKPQARPLE